MSAKLWSDLVKIEKWISKNVIKEVVENKEVEDIEEVEDIDEDIPVEKIAKIHNDFAIWEALNHPNTCLSKNYKKEKENEERILKTFQTLFIRQNKQVVQENLERYTIENLKLALNLIWQAQQIAMRKYKGEKMLVVIMFLVNFLPVV